MSTEHVFDVSAVLSHYQVTKHAVTVTLLSMNDCGAVFHTSIIARFSCSSTEGKLLWW